MAEQRESSPKVPDGATAYTGCALRCYDFIVHFLVDRIFWRCKARHLIEHSQSHLSDNHLEVGIGSGKLFRKTVGQHGFDRLVIADINPNCLAVAKRNLKEFKPELISLNLLDADESSLEHLSDFRSIGMNYVLHCLPLSLEEKVDLCCCLVERCVIPGGVLFGSTLMPDLCPNRRSKRLMKFYNHIKLFSNQNDSVHEFKELLSRKGFDCELSESGAVSLFKIQKGGKI